MIIKSRSFFVSLFTLLGLLLLTSINVNADTSESVSGDISIVSELKTPLTNVSPDDLDRVENLCATQPGYTFNTNNGVLTLDSSYDDSGEMIKSSIGQAEVTDAHFSVPIDPNNPTLTVSDKLGNVIGTYNVPQSEINSNNVNITLKLDFQKQADANSASDDPANSIEAVSNSGYYAGQQDGHTYSEGVHVDCNDFNGPSADHKWWKKTSHPFKAALDFAGSDCAHHLKAYKCAMSSYFFSSNHKCHGLRKSNPTNCSAWEGGASHVNWPHTLWYRN